MEKAGHFLKGRHRVLTENRLSQEVLQDQKLVPVVQVFLLEPSQPVLFLDLEPSLSEGLRLLRLERPQKGKNPGDAVHEEGDLEGLPALLASLGH